jgi:hypothetical protein
VRSLVLCNLAQLDHFDPFPSALNDEDLRSYWHRQYTALQRALVRSAESARQLSAVFTRLRGTDGELMVRNLRGYSPEQLESGAAAELVRQLEHSSLDVRVVAFETLRRITGRTLNYRPERETKQRRTALVSWQKLLREGRLVYQSVPTPRGPEPPTDERPQGSGSSGP